MPGNEDPIIHGRKDTIRYLVRLWDHPEAYPETFNSFTGPELAALNALKSKNHFFDEDALFMSAMVVKLLWKAD